jgi:hypothetical protein
MYIENYLEHLEEMILEILLNKRLKKRHYRSLVYFYWCLQNFYTKLPDESVRVDFKADKEDLECYELVLDDYGITFSMSGNLFTENGHDSYSNNFGELVRNKDEIQVKEYLQSFSGWFEIVHSILEEKSPIIDTVYYGEFLRSNDIELPEEEIEDDFEEGTELEEVTNERGTWIYKYGNDNSLRFILGKKGNNPLIVVGLNPSTADHHQLDATSRSIDRISKIQDSTVGY